MGTLRVSVGPTVEPFTYAQLADHMRLNTLDEDVDTAEIEYLDRIIKSVRTYTEGYLNRSLNNQTLIYYLDSFPCENYIELPRPPLKSVSSVVYTDSGATDNTFSSTYYHTDSYSAPGKIVLAYSQSWPSATLKTSNPIAITYSAGYGANPEDVPERIVQAMMIMAADLYENREGIIIGQTPSRLQTYRNLLLPYRIIPV